MQFLKAGEPAESNIFNQFDERKRALLRLEGAQGMQAADETLW